MYTILGNTSGNVIKYHYPYYMSSGVYWAYFKNVILQHSVRKYEFNWSQH